MKYKMYVDKAKALAAKSPFLWSSIEMNMVDEQWMQQVNEWNSITITTNTKIHNSIHNNKIETMVNC